MFKRYVEDRIVKSLIINPLFIEKLNPDIEKGEVFPAIRNGYIDFYFKGGRLFTFKDEFQTHIKYASVFKNTGSNNYIAEHALSKIDKIDNFIDGYERIKENCSLYSGQELSGVSHVYSQYSFAKKTAGNIVVLDIEVSFESLSSGQEERQDRIDLLVLNKKDSKLRFYEAKHYSNPEIWSKEGTKPKVVHQIKKYNNQIQKRESEILSQYANYINTINDLFKLDFEPPRYIQKETTLLIFGFDRDQLKGRFSKLIRNDHSLDGIDHYSIGDISTVNIVNMWKRQK